MKCNNCGYISFTRRYICPVCRSTSFIKDEVSLSEKICWKLYATPEGFPEKYTLCLVEDKGVKGFKRIENI
ncbi:MULTISPECIES: zinc ribbon domain-containing protein [Acidianus]|uniref:ChsH2 rubredoxin-like zinc ribbon domain-containing protein n=1 Tax=Candidatus Acidianus copahuensis TaxID=1160895 RepID=A0A031LU02_9CREN|nr:MULTISPECIES: hypothetical protein [Acidianus]EZQ10583.1 hypothetical protein CM19_03910 [Candidatus Acidianus copahuensis]